MPDGRRKWFPWCAVGILPLMAACSSGADAEESQPTVLETGSPVEDEDPTAAAEEDSNSPEESSEQPEDASHTPDPVPASSEGPAENWPEPEIPDEIYEPTEEGAEALIQYWFDARHHARITGDVEVLEYVSLEECELCAVQLDRLGDLYPRGWFVESEPSTVVEQYVREEAEGTVSGIFALEEAEFQSYWDGELHGDRSRDQLDVFGLDFRYADGRWQAFDFSHLGTTDEEISPDDARDFQEGG